MAFTGKALIKIFVQLTDEIGLNHIGAMVT